MSLEAAVLALTAELKRHNDSVAGVATDPAPAKATTKAAAKTKAAEPAPTAPAEPEAPAAAKITLSQLQEKCVELVTATTRDNLVNNVWTPMKVARASDLKDNPEAMATAYAKIDSMLAALASV